MSMEFRDGDPERPRGHALVYFHDPDGRVYATYLVVAPITIDLAKYMPPLFAGQIPTPALEVAAMPLPPVPEIVADEAWVERLARLRGDDLIYGGRLVSASVERLLTATAEVGQRYGAAVQSWTQRAEAIAPAAAPATELDVDDVMIDLMGESDRIGELARRIGRLRYALDGGESSLIVEARGDVERVARRLPPKYRAAEVLAAASTPGRRGARLAQLHVDRCYKLATEEYAEVARIEAEIRGLGD